MIRAKRNPTNGRAMAYVAPTVVNGEIEVIHFYWHESDSLQHVDIEALRNGSQLTLTQREELVRPIAVKEIEEALYGIGDLKSPGIDGNSSKFFKSCWRIVKDDVVKAAQEFFKHKMLFTPFNQNVVTLVPKYEGCKICQKLQTFRRLLYFLQDFV